LKLDNDVIAQTDDGTLFHIVGAENLQAFDVLICLTKLT